MIKDVLVISPHLDDESLGAGGYLLKLRDEGVNVHWLNITSAKREYGYSEEECLKEKGQIELINSQYGFKSFHNLELKPSALDSIPLGELISQIRCVLFEIKPEMVILPYGDDVHSDHRLVFYASYSCLKKFRFPCVKKIICMEIISETDNVFGKNRFEPDMFVNIDLYLENKLSICASYVSEVHDVPFPRNVEAIRGLAAYRGATAYCKYAEAYKVIREYV